MLTRSVFFFGSFWTLWRRWAALSVCVGAIILLGALRFATDAELTFASLGLLPVLVSAWINGRRTGLLVAFFATAMWLVSDIATERQFSAGWIPWANAITRMITYSVAVLMVSQIRLQFEREHKYATHDVLTGLQNRRAFFEAGTFEVERAKRYGHSMAVIFLDLDNFKKLNDSKGHDAGDAALRATAKGLVQTVRTTDRVARMGGDEFSVLLPETGFDAAVIAGKKISALLDVALKAFPPVKVSVGVAWFGKVDRLFPAMLKVADELMYEEKQSEKHDVRSRRVTEP